jgi:hypothetical protein
MKTPIADALRLLTSPEAKYPLEILGIKIIQVPSSVTGELLPLPELFKEYEETQTNAETEGAASKLGETSSNSPEATGARGAGAGRLTEDELESIKAACRSYNEF